MRAAILVSAVALFGVAAPAAAQERPMAPRPEAAARGTPAEAAELRRALTTYLTSAPFENGIVRVEPDANGHRITLDPAAFLSGLLGSPVEFAPFAMVVSERPDGDWNVFSDDALNASMTMDLGGVRQSTQYSQQSSVFKGVYSPALRVFTAGRGQAGKTTTRSSDDNGNTLSTIDGATVELSASPGPDGTANVRFNQVYGAVTQSNLIKLPAQAGADFSDLSIEFEAETIETSGSAQALRAGPLLDVYAFLLARLPALTSDPQALAGPAGEELKTGLRAMLPIWDGLETTATARGINVSTLLGDARLATATQVTRLSGVSSDAFVEVDFQLDGFELDSAMIPSWMDRLIPGQVQMAFAVENVDLAEPIGIVLDELDLSQDVPLSPQAQERVLRAFDAGRIGGRIGPSRIRADDFDISLSGEATFAGMQPELHLDVTAAGLDRTIETLKIAAASEPDIHQAIGVLQIAKGFGKPLDDGRIQWLVDVAEDGSITLNGAMLKGPDPASDIEEKDQKDPGLKHGSDL